METVTDYFLRLQNHCRWWLHPWNLKTLSPWKKSYDQLRQHIKKKRHYFADKGLSSQSYSFSSSQVWMWELDHTESWVLKIDGLNCGVGKTLETPLDRKEIKPVNPKGNQSWIFIGRTDAEAEAPILWPPDAKSQHWKKILMLGRIEGRRRRGQQDEMVGWHHQLSGHEFKQTIGDHEGQGSLRWCSPQGCKESDTT